MPRAHRPRQPPHRPLCRAALIATALLGRAATAPAQAPGMTRADSALVFRILTAEDRREADAPALAEGRRHRDPRLRRLAMRAMARTLDPTFADRDALPPVVPAPSPSAPAWPEPGWRLRLRALGPTSDCPALGASLADSAWPVRLRAAALVDVRCAEATAIGDALERWLTTLPPGEGPRPRGGVSWHAGAAALEALARLRPATARAALDRFTRHPAWPVRQAAARAAATLGDTARLRHLTRDADGNVQEAAIAALAHVTGHGDDSLYLQRIEGASLPAVLAAATALRGSPLPEAADRALAAWRRWAARARDPERDVRAALLAVAGRPASDDIAPSPRPPVPPEAVALALGAERRLRVVMDDASGGGAFVVRLRGDLAPVMGARLLALVRAGHYDGLTWHRVEHDFVIQGGSPGANEYVGVGPYLRDEVGTVAHPRGSVGMSTRGHDTGDAQWFVNLRDNPRLRRDYTVWAEVVEGMDVVDGIMAGDRIARIVVEVPARVR